MVVMSSAVPDEEAEDTRWWEAVATRGRTRLVYALDADPWKALGPAIDLCDRLGSDALNWGAGHGPDSARGSFYEHVVSLCEYAESDLNRLADHRSLPGTTESQWLWQIPAFGRSNRPVIIEVRRCPAPRRADEDRLWYALDVDEGVVAVDRTRRAVMQLAGVPLRREWSGRWERIIYGPHSEEIHWSYPDEESGDEMSIEHGLAGLHSGGWEHWLERWRYQGSPVGVRVDDMDPPNHPVSPI